MDVGIALTYVAQVLGCLMFIGGLALVVVICARPGDTTTYWLHGEQISRAEYEYLTGRGHRTTTRLD